MCVFVPLATPTETAPQPIMQKIYRDEEAHGKSSPILTQP